MADDAVEAAIVEETRFGPYFALDVSRATKAELQAEVDRLRALEIGDDWIETRDWNRRASMVDRLLEHIEWRERDERKGKR